MARFVGIFSELVGFRYGSVLGLLFLFPFLWGDWESKCIHIRDFGIQMGFSYSTFFVIISLFILSKLPYNTLLLIIVLLSLRSIHLQISFPGFLPCLNEAHFPSFLANFKSTPA